MGLAPYENAIQAIASMFGKVADAFKTSKEHQLETSVVKEDKRQEKALEAANIAFDLISKNDGYLPKDIVKDFYKQKKIFDKNIT